MTGRKSYIDRVSSRQQYRMLYDKSKIGCGSEIVNRLLLSLKDLNGGANQS